MPCKTLFFRSGKSYILFLLTVLFQITVSAQPAITSFSPAAGPLGTSITISGSNFNPTPGNNTVFIGAVKAVVSTASSSSLTVAVPVGTTYQPISVTTNNLTAYSNQRFNVTFPGGGAFAATTFGNKTDFLTGANPIDICTADFDGDGRLDIATANNVGNTASVFRNEGGPGIILYAPKIDLTTNSFSQSINTGDVDGDGKIDLLVTSVSPATVSIYRNISTAGNIAFAAKVDFTTGTDPSNVVVNDIDADGKPDLIVSNYNSFSVSIFRNTSSGSNIAFATKVDFTTGALLPRRIVINDFDGDGKADVAVAVYNSTSNALYVFKNNSTTGVVSLLPFIQLPSSGAAWSIDAGDLDGDGKTDIAIVNYSSSTLSVFRNQSTSGTLSFANKVDFTTGSFPESITINDFNGDGKPDIATGNYTANSVSLFNNTCTAGNISFATKFDYPTGTNPRGICSGDFDNDGKPEFATANLNGGNFSMYRNTIAATSTAIPVINSFTPASGSTGAGVTINGANFGVTPVANVVYFGATRATVTSANSTTLTVTSPVGLTYEPITVTTGGLTAYSAKPYSVTFPGGGPLISASFGVKNDFATDNYPRHSSLSDIDGDGKPDMIIVNNNAGSISIFKNASVSNTVSFSTGLHFPVSGNNPFSTCKGDLDGDGKPDIVVTNYDVHSISIFRNTSTPGSISLAPKIDYSAGINPISVTIADFDADGKPDIVVVNNNSNTVTVLKNYSTAGTLIFGPLSSYPVGDWPQACVAGDVDGDGKTDIIITNYNSNTISVLRNTSAGGSVSFASKIDFATGTNPFNLAIGDLDGDNKNDVVVTNSNAASVSVFRNTSTAGAVSFAPTPTITTGNIPLGISITDLDGDDKPDLGVANFGANSLSVFRNTGSTGVISFSPRVDFTTGFSPRSVSIGDIDGDNKPDLSSANSNSNTFSVLRNQTNEYQTIVFCANSDTTLQSDITGTNYQWQVNTGNGFFNIFNNSNYAGTSTRNLVLKTIPLAWNNYQYRCRIDGNNNSKIFLITPVTSSAPSVSITSSSNNICAGTNVVFNASAINGGSAPIFQWQLNDVNIGSNSSVFSIDTLDNGDRVSIKLTSSLSCAIPVNITSNIITVTVNKLDTPLVRVTYNNVLTVTNTDAGATYQWEIQNTNGSWGSLVPAAMGSIYTAYNNGTYRVKGSKGACLKYSAPEIIIPDVVSKILVARSYPNPVRDEFVIDSLKLTDNWETLTIINSDGKQFISPVNIKNKTIVTISLGALKTGFYFAVLRRKNGQPAQIRFIKE